MKLTKKSKKILFVCVIVLALYLIVNPQYIVGSTSTVVPGANVGIVGYCGYVKEAYPDKYVISSRAFVLTEAVHNKITSGGILSMVGGSKGVLFFVPPYESVYQTFMRTSLSAVKASSISSKVILTGVPIRSLTSTGGCGITTTTISMPIKEGTYYLWTVWEIGDSATGLSRAVGLNYRKVIVDLPQTCAEKGEECGSTTSCCNLDSIVCSDTQVCVDKMIVVKCGDGVCDKARGETCSDCASDCGNCQSCGDGTCSSSESCSSCVADCGSCDLPKCGDGICDSEHGETESLCAQDCGSNKCEGSCSDAQVFDKNCNCVCFEDCGVLGQDDETCECENSDCPKGTKDCGGGNCLADCDKDCVPSCDDDNELCVAGKCVPKSDDCGDGDCGLFESCTTCPSDCGSCVGCTKDSECKPDCTSDVGCYCDKIKGFSSGVCEIYDKECSLDSQCAIGWRCDSDNTGVCIKKMIWDDLDWNVISIAIFGLVILVVIVKMTTKGRGGMY